ncbi:serine hydrolase domain-containing protein [Spirosoma validum]|nr:serine hydrolase domain-containing protein [Spirosoma validum]
MTNFPLLPDMFNNSCPSKVAIRLGMVALSSVFFTACSSLLNDHPLTGPQPSSQSRVQKAVNNVRTALEKELGNSVPSLNLYIETPTEKIFASSVPAGATPYTENTNFRFASNTKTFTSTAILKMHQDGYLNIHAKISDNIPGSNIPYVPNTTEWDFPFKNEITIEQLLQHSAGVYDVDNGIVPGTGGLSYTAYTQGVDSTHQFTADELVKPLVWYKLYSFPPGTGFKYSNTGYTILGYIIARIYSTKFLTPKTYEDYLRDHIVGGIAPVQLAIHFPVRADDTKMPDPYVMGIERNLGKVPKIYKDYNMSAQVAEGNGYSSPASLNTFVRTLMKGQNVLTSFTVDSLMQADIKIDTSNRNHYALGCFFTPNMGFGHNGERCGTLSLMAYDPVTDVSVVAFINLVDKSDGKEGQNSTFAKCFTAIYNAAWDGRAALGYPGRP